jgi:Dehydrogenases (flavoproteins)
MPIDTTYDLIVIGAGAAGLATAHRAAELGGRVLILEKSERHGGSAALSAGILWTAPTVEVLNRIQPDADPVLGPAVVNGFAQAVEDVRRAGASVSEPWDDHLEWGLAHKIDVDTLFSAWIDGVRKAGGELVTSVLRSTLISNDAGISGVEFTVGGVTYTASAPAVALCTGGFQGDPELKQQFIGHGADDIAVRSNPGSVGDGFRLGSTAGGAASRHLSGFYGHTLPSPVEVGPEVFLRLTLYFSAYGILVNREGRRFTDESLGDEVSNQRLLRQTGRRGVLIWDDSVQQDRALAVPYPSGLALDRFSEARKLGARAVEVDTLDELVEQVGEWGVDRAALEATLSTYRRASSGESVALDAPLPERPSPLERGPFRALEIQPCITIPFGGRAGRRGRSRARPRRRSGARSVFGGGGCRRGPGSPVRRRHHLRIRVRSTRGRGCAGGTLSHR